MRIGSLFSGYGGLDMAVQEVLGGTLAWYSEIEPAACQVLAAHHSGVPNLGDITRVDWADVEPVDILTGGYPCQPFSHAGQRKGTNDERHLWPYVCDAIAALRPLVTVLENVDGHRSLGLDVVLGDLADLGLPVRWGVVRAADAGAPHGRKRVFIIVTDSDGSRWHEDVQQPGDIGAAPSQGQSGEPDGHRADRPAADAGGAGPQGAVAVPPGRVGAGRAGGVRPVPRAGAAADADHAGQQDGAVAGLAQHGATQSDRDLAADADGDGHGRELHARGVGSLEAGHEGEPRERQRARGESGAGGDLAAPDADGHTASGSGDPRLRQADALIASDGTERRGSVDWGRYAAAIHRWESVLGRPAPDPTIPGPSGRPRLSPAFVEWMMGLPEGHVTGHGLKPAACLKMLGNGVVPQQAALALRMLLADEVAA